MRNRSAIFAGILAGLTSPGTVFSAPPQYPALQGSDLARMRRCAQRVGNDFRQVIAREHGKTNRQGE